MKNGNITFILAKEVCLQTPVGVQLTLFGLEKVYVTFVSDAEISLF